MEKYIVTGYTPAYWNNWGVSWLASLKESGTKANVVIAHKGDLLAATHDALVANGVRLVPVGGVDDMRLQTWSVIPSLAKSNPGIYAFWDGDVYFQEDVSSIFDLASDKMAVCQNLNPGMAAAPAHLWEFFLDFYKAADHITPGIAPVDLLGAFALHFPKFVSVQDNTWNFTSIPLLKAGEKLTYKDAPVKVVHPSGYMKHLPETRPYLFSERRPDLCSRWGGIMNKKGVSARSLLKRVQPTKDIY